MDHVSARRLIKRMQNVLRTDAGIDGDAQRLAQIAWLLYFKVATTTSSHSNDTRVSLWRSYTWTAYRDRFASGREGIVRFTNEELLPNLKLLASSSEVVAGAGAIEDFNNYVTSDEVLGEMVDLIDRLPLQSEEDRHVIGDVYETLLSSLKNAKNSGEFYTPRSLTRFMAEVLSPIKGSSILDPASGTGGFLVSVLECVRAKEGEEAARSLILHAREKKSLPHLLCSTNLLLHNYTDLSKILRVNPLTNYQTTCSEDEAFDYVLANPPFGGEEESGVDASFPIDLKSRDTSLLFILHILSCLKTGGRAGVIVPDGFMFQTGVSARVRKKLLTECDLEAVVRLPKGAFSPYTGIETNILFFKKGKCTKKVNFYDHQYPEGVKTYSKTKPLQFSELRSLAHHIRDNGPLPAKGCLTVSIKEIEKQGWSLNFRSQVKANTPSLTTTMHELETSSVAQLTLASRLATSLADNQFKSAELSSLASLVPKLTRSPKALAALERAILSVVITGSFPNQRQPLPFVAEQRRGWQLVRLEDLGRIVGGATPPADDPANFEAEGVPWLTPADLRGSEAKYVSHGRRSLSHTGFRACSAELLPKGSVLFSSRAPIGYVGIAANPLCTNQGFKSCVLDEISWSDYLYYYLRFAAVDIDRSAPGTTFKEMSGKAMKKVEVLLPPISDRNMIVNWLDDIFDQIRHLRIAIYDEMKWQDILHQVLVA